MASTSPAAVNKAAHTVIAISDVHRHFGKVQAVNGVDLTISSGELFGLIGHNGAGKSTLFKMMLGLIPVSSGQIKINDVAVEGKNFRNVRRSIGYLPENIVMYDNLTGLETLHFFARLKRVATDNCAAVLERVGLSHAANRRVREYSKGMRQRLGFAQALLGQPKILFLDEPTNGLDPEAIRMFYAILRELRGQGVTAIITSHILTEIQERVDRLAIMNSGKIQAVGTVTELREKMALPLRFEIRVSAEDSTLIEALQQKLAAIPNTTLNQGDNSTTWVIECPHQNKMAVFTLLQALGNQLLDIHLQNPSLEDLFFGLLD